MARILYHNDSELTLEVSVGDFKSYWFDEGFMLSHGFDNVYIMFDTKEELIEDALEELYNGADTIQGTCPGYNPLFGYELEEENIKVEWEDIGEGLSGDYTGEEWDTKFLRFYISKREAGTPLFEDVENGSWCTRTPVNTDRHTLNALLELIMKEVKEPVMNGESIKKLSAELSWIGPDWLDTPQPDEKWMLQGE